MRFGLSVRLFAVLCLSVAPGILWAASPEKDWPTFRGANRTAVSIETGLLQQWPAEGPKLLWEAAGAGRGYASLAIAGGKIFSLGDGSSLAEDKDEYLLAFDQAGGKLLWKAKVGAPWTSGSADWQNSRSTPTVDGERIYALSAFGSLLCCETATGKELWRKDLKKDFGGKKADGWGYSESPLIDGDRLIVTPGGTTATMVALNKYSGDEVWRAVRADDRGAGHGSVVISTIGGLRVYVQSTGSGAMGVRADDGKLLWTFDAKATAIIPTPIVRDDLVFFTAGYGCGGALLRQVPESGGVKIDEIYPLNPALSNKHGGVVLVGDHLFGDSDSSGMPFCAELMTGQIKWKERGPGRGSAAVAAADGCLYYHFTDGTVALMKASPDGRTISGQFKAPGSGDRPSWSHPVILDGKLYLREGDKMLCYDVKNG